MYAWPTVARVTALTTIMTLVVCIGCKRPKSSASNQTRQQRAMADREEELQFRDEDGNTDWRGRVDAAKASLEQAKSHENWGQESAALEKALDAARLLPPASKVFDLPETQLASSNGQNDASKNNPSEGGQGSANLDASDSFPGAGLENAGDSSKAPDGTSDPLASRNDGADKALSDAGAKSGSDRSTAKRVTDQEVDAIRKELNEFLASIEQDVGTLRHEVRLDREAIEIE